MLFVVKWLILGEENPDEIDCVESLREVSSGGYNLQAFEV